MTRLALAAALAALLAWPAAAALNVGDKAPDFTAPAYLAGKPMTFSLADARRKGPVVVYFFPAAHTKGCNLEAHLFSEAIDQFKAAGATVIGVTAGNVSQLAAFSQETEYCGGRFPVAADPQAAIAKTYDLKVMSLPVIEGQLTQRTSYVVSPTGQVLAAYSNSDPTDHISQTLAAVKAWRAKK